MTAEVIDLFCGIGGLSAGFRKEGFEVLAGFDSDATCRYAYERNIGAKFVSCDITDVPSTQVGAHYTGTRRRVLVGCAPCQPFSIYTGRYRQSREEKGDERWRLLEEFGRLVEEIRPDVVSMENVLRVRLHPVFVAFVTRLEVAGYHVTVNRVCAEDYGVPQRRNRLVLFASLHGPVELVEPTHRGKPATVKDAIGSLPAIGAGEAQAEDPLHMCRGLSDRNMVRMRATSEGGSWKDWDPSLMLACHKKTGGETFRSVYGRMSWNEPAPVITTQCLGIGNGRFGHPEQDRAISIREASLLQSFPPSFEFVEPGQPVSGQRLARQIGNAVPVDLGRAVARSIRAHLAAVDGYAMPPTARTSQLRKTKALKA